MTNERKPMLTAPATILYVDDNETSRFALSLILRAAGYHVREAATGREALRLVAGRPDLVLLDVNLPDMSGFEVCQRLKACRATAPVLFVSAISVDTQDRVHGLSVGAEGYLTKPLEPTELVAQVNALLRLRRAEADDVRSRLAAIVESSADAIIGMLPDGIIDSWNQGAEQVFGYASEEALGKPFAFLIPPSRSEELPGILERLRQGEAVPPYETVRQRKDGSLVDVLLSISPLKDREARLLGASAIAHDMTARKRLEEQLRQTHKLEALGRLAGGVAHDFNNLLTIINGYSQVLLDSLPEHDKGRELVAEIGKAGERAAGLTQQLLAYSRKQILQLKVLDVNDLVTNLKKMLSRMIGEDVVLTTRLAPDLHPVLADAGQIEQVLMNLSVNARDAMPAGGKLTIETANVRLDETSRGANDEVQYGCYVRITVSDTGCGMDAATQARIFEPFFTTKGPGQGTGLGLAMVYGIVKQSGGSIKVASAPERGTTFTLYLPSLGDEVPPGKGQPAAGKTLVGTETVLLVEDEDAVRTILHHLLQRRGYNVLMAANGTEALAVAAQHSSGIDLLVTDVVMPGMDGRQVAEALRRLHPNMQVLFLSGYTDDAIMRHGILESETAFLQKPFASAALAKKVRELLDQPAGHG